MRVVVMRRTDGMTRSSLRLTREGVQAVRERRRRSTNGGWYVRDLLTVPWPWRGGTRRRAR